MNFKLHGSVVDDAEDNDVNAKKFLKCRSG
jgi:hypothetical protein